LIKESLSSSITALVFITPTPAGSVSELKPLGKYQAANPNGPFSNYLSLLTAHRWICAAEAYDYEGKAEDAERSRQVYEQKLSIARQSKVLLIRTAAERLAVRGRCHSPK